jgi:hypothetical protein
MEINYFSVKDADFSLCVLSLPDLISNGPSPGKELEVILPSTISELVGPNTYFLLNKSDLVSNISAVSSIHVRSGKADGPVFSIVDGRFWAASLVTGNGIHSFVHGLAESLKTQ